MTDKQKEAVRVLNRIKEQVITSSDIKMLDVVISDDEYFLLLEFIPQPTIPWTEPGSPYYHYDWKITCE
jgi:hypothetical protein